MIHWVRSFTVRMPHSILPTCSLAAVVFTIALSNLPLIHSNSQSIRSSFTMKPPLEYTLMILVNEFLSCLTLRDGKYLAVYSLISWLRVASNGNPLMNIISATRVTYLWRANKSFGMSRYSISTRVGFFLMVFPLNPAQLGPKVVWALVMSCTLILEFLRFCSSPSV